MAELHTFERGVRHDCGYLHLPGAVTHRLIIRVDRRRNTVARLEAFVCNGCHSYGGKWTVADEPRRRVQNYFVVWTEQ